MVSEGKIKTVRQLLDLATHWSEVALRAKSRAEQRSALSQSGAQSELATRELIELLKE